MTAKAETDRPYTPRLSAAVALSILEAGMAAGRGPSGRGVRP